MTQNSVQLCGKCSVGGEIVVLELLVVRCQKCKAEVGGGRSHATTAWPGLVLGREAAGAGAEPAMTLPGWALGALSTVRTARPLASSFPTVTYKRSAVFLDDNNNHLEEYRPRLDRYSMAKGESW